MERAHIHKGRFIPGPDHFVLSDVTWEGYRNVMERLREVVLETKPGSQELHGVGVGKESKDMSGAPNPSEFSVAKSWFGDLILVPPQEGSRFPVSFLCDGIENLVEVIKSGGILSERWQREAQEMELRR